MAEELRRIVVENLIFIKDNIMNLDDVADALFRYDVYTEEMKQQIQEMESKEQKISTFICNIQLQRPIKVDVFYDVLSETDNKHVLDYLRPGWEEEHKGRTHMGGAGELRHAVDFPEDWPNEAAMTARIQVKACNVDSHIVTDYWINSAVYSMKKQCRGRCVIISNTVFSGPLELVYGVQRVTLPVRYGTQKDQEKLTELFTQLHFTVVPHTEKTAAEIRTILMNEANLPDHKDAEAFACIICSHGSAEGIYGTDGEIVSLDDVTSVFESQNCPALCEKPKMFFIQACQGEDKGAVTTVTTSPNIDHLPTAVRIPSKADMFVASATHPGFVSLRNTTYGSWFLQAVIYVFQRHAHKEDITGLLTLVNNLVARGRSFDAAAKQDIMQAAYFKSSLLKKFYFFPGICQQPARMY